MKFAASALLAALVASVSAKPIITNTDFSITEGKPYEITWDQATGPVKLTVLAGDPKDLKAVQTITSSGSGTKGSFTWTPKDLPSGTYAFEIKDSSPEPNYSQQFQYTGTGTASSSSRSSSSTPTPTTSASTTSNTSSTTSTNSSSSSKTSTSTSTTSTSSNAPRPTTNNNDSTKYKSPLAFVLVTVASLVYFH